MLYSQLINIFKHARTSIQSVITSTGQQLKDSLHTVTAKLAPHWQVPQNRYSVLIFGLTLIGGLTTLSLPFFTLLGASVVSAGLTFISVEIGVTLLNETKQMLDAKADAVQQTLASKADAVQQTLAHKADKAIRKTKKVIRESTLELSNTLFSLGEDVREDGKKIAKKVIKKSEKILAHSVQELNQTLLTMQADATQKLIETANPLLKEGESTLKESKVIANQSANELNKTLLEIQKATARISAVIEPLAQEGQSALKELKTASNNASDSLYFTSMPGNLCRSVVHAFSREKDPKEKEKEKGQSTDSAQTMSQDSGKNDADHPDNEALLKMDRL